MKHTQANKSTQSLINLGMALHGDKDALETRIRGIFSRGRSHWGAKLGAILMAVALVLSCFTTACHPVTASSREKGALLTAASSGGNAVLSGDALLSFDGFAHGVLDKDRIIVMDAQGKEHSFTWVDEGLRQTMDGAQEPSDPIPEGAYATPGEVALHAAETAVTIWGDAVPSCKIHINMYTGDGQELVYYGIGFDGTPFETAKSIYGYADAVTGTVLYLDNNYWGQLVKQYGNGTINEKVSAWDWGDERYANARTSQKALATAEELIHSCFPAGKIIPKDPAVWDAGSHTDGEQILWAGGYVAVVDAYVRTDADPCYYVQVAVPLEEGADPAITIFGCYPLGWEYCCNQIHDPAVLREEMADMEAFANDTPGRTVAPGETKRVYGIIDEDALANAASYAINAVGQMCYVKDDVYDPEFIEEQGRERIISIGFIDICLGTADPWSAAWVYVETPADVERYALPGQTLEFLAGGLWAVYVGDGQCVYAKAESDGMGVITQASVKEMMQGSGCLLQNNDYMVISPALEALIK
ncbi:MAG: hypothetical protein IJR17_02465 [Clostridia bacterium]|nr:hypothetical protein [Clostridia bacterium]